MKPADIQPRFAFWSQTYRGWRIRGYCMRGVGEVISVQGPDYTVHQTKCTTVKGARAFIRRQQEKANATTQNQC